MRASCGVDASPGECALPTALLRVTQLIRTGFSGSFEGTVSPAPAGCPGAVPVRALPPPVVGGRVSASRVSGHLATLRPPGDLCRFPLSPAGVRHLSPTTYYLPSQVLQFLVGAAFFHLFSGHFASSLV